MSQGLRTELQNRRLGEPATGARRRQRRIIAAVAFCILSSLAPRGTAQDLDVTRRALAGVRKNLVWENVRSTPQYIRGVRPKRRIPITVATVILAPGQATVFFVPSHEMIRVVSADNQRIDDGLTQIWTSNGSGMYRKQISAFTSGGCSILATPNETGYSIAKVCRSSTAIDTVTLAIYTSARPPLTTLDYYNCRIQTSGHVSISDDRGTRPRKYSKMSGGRRVQFAIPGASRLRIEARLRYDLQPQRRQTFWIRAFVDGRLYRVLSMDTEPTNRRRQFVDGQERLIGRREFAYLDLDCGDKKVEIETSHDCYLRIDGVGLELCRPNLNRSFDYPKWENLRKAVTIWDALDFDPQDILSDVSSIELANRYGVDPSLLNLTGDPLWDPYLNQQRMQAIARDNSIPHGGLRAYMWLLACVSRHFSDARYGDEIDLDDLCQRIRNRYTHFRDASMLEMPGASTMRRAAYFRRQVRRPDEDRTERIIGAQHLESSLSLIGQVNLVDVTDDCTEPLVYRFPAGLGTSLVRLVVDQTHLTGNTRLMVRYDDRSPMEFLVSPDVCLERRQLVPTTGEAALSALSGTYGKYDQLTAGGPFAMYREPVPAIRAATAEIVRPSDVRQMQVWIESCDERCSDVPIGIGVQYLDGRTSELSETSYRFLQNIVDTCGQDDLSAVLARKELDNDALQLESELRDHHRSIRDSVRRSPLIDSPTDLWDQDAINGQQSLIDDLVHEKNWPAAIELLSDLIKHTQGEVRHRAVFARVDALSSADEDFLAETELRGWMVFSDDSGFRAEVFQRLIDRAGDDRYQRLRYLAFAAIEWSDRSFERRLAQELADASRYRDALILLSSLESAPETEDLLLRCSLQTQWWTTFDATLNGLREPAKKNLWMGLKQWRLGFYQHAEKALSAGESIGREWLAYGKAAEQIFHQLSRSDAAIRLDTIGRWEQWQTRHPGRKRWRIMPSAIHRAHGTAQSISAARGKRSGYAVATPDRPVEVMIQGPVRVKVLVRPIHRNLNSPQAVDDWLHLESGGASTLVPISGNSVSSTLRLEDRSEPIGRLVESIMDLPPGRNRFKVYCAEHRCLVQIAAERPEIALPMLPPVNAATMATIVQGHFGKVKHVCQTTIDPNECRDCVRVFRRDHKCLTTPITYVAAPCRCTHIDAAQRQFNSLPFGDVAQWHDRVVPVDPLLVVEDQNATVSAAIAITHQSEIDARAREPNPLDHTPDPRLFGLVRLSEMSDDSDPEVRSLKNRLRSGTTWELFRQFDSRAGLHSVDIERWMPESPPTRIRRDLMPDHPARYSLAGQSQLMLEINDDETTTFELAFIQPSIGFVPVPEAKSIIETRSRSLTVSCPQPDLSVAARIEMPPGRNSIGISLGDQVPNQFVLADLYEIDEFGDRLPIDHGNVRRVRDKRTYQVATAEQPLVIRISGPAVMRVDRYLNGVTTSEYVTTLEDRTLTYAPPTGDDPALYRVFQLTHPRDSIGGPVTTQLSSSSQEGLDGRNDLASDDWIGDVVQAAYDEIDHPESLAAVDSLSLRSGDLHPLSVHFDRWADPQNAWPGTKGMGVRFRSRFAADEFPQPRSNDEFVELRASHLQYHRWRDHYTDTDVLVRTRESGSPTVGLDHRGTKDFSIDVCDPWAHSDRWSPLRLDYRGYVLGQFDVARPDGSPAPSDIWTTGFRAGLSRRQFLSPNVSGQWAGLVFARSVRENRVGYLPGSIDQDIFTRYKSDHPWGLRLTHRLLYQNNLDSRWWIGPFLVSNSDQWVPDNAGMHVGTDQLFGPLQIRLSYRLTEYFADNDRRKSQLQNVVYADLLLAHDHNRDRWSEWILSIRNDLTNNKTSVGVNFVHYVNDGRGFRDFRPGTVLFRNLREERATRRYLFEP